MNKGYLKAYGALVTANGMFKSISHFPLHHSFNSHNAIDMVFSYEKKLTNEEYNIKQKVNKGYQIITLTSHIGESLTNDLAVAFENDTLQEFNAYEVVKPKITAMLQYLNEDELKDFINIATKLQEFKADNQF